MARLLVVLVLCAGYWLLPISGRVLILTDSTQRYQEIWPQMWVEPPAARPGQALTLYVRDNAPWSYVKLVVDGSEMPRDEAYGTGKQPWTWRWRFPTPEQPGVAAVFYHDCHTGCIERTHMMLGVPQPSDTHWALRCPEKER